MATPDKIKAGNLYLYNMDPEIDKNGKYVNLPVIALSENSYLKTIRRTNAEYPTTWVCLLPNLTTGGLAPKDMTDITAE